MSRKRIELRRIREILRLHHELKFSDREIARAFKMSHSTVSKIHTAVHQAGYTWPLPEEVDNNMLERICYPQRTHKKTSHPQPDWDGVWKQMQRKGMTLRLQSLRYKDRHSDGYQYMSVLRTLQSMVPQEECFDAPGTQGWSKHRSRLRRYNSAPYISCYRCCEAGAGVRECSWGVRTPVL